MLKAMDGAERFLQRGAERVPPAKSYSVTAAAAMKSTCELYFSDGAIHDLVLL